MTSSLRNSLHRRNHKERSQPAHRSKLGVLEKHGDYVKRARDYHSKQDRLNRLKQKAAERNKDEFYFSMTKEKTKEGVHIQSRGNVALPTDVVKTLKTQDENYIRTMRAAGLKKIDKIKNHLTEMSDLLDNDEHMGAKLDENDLDILKEAKVVARSNLKPAKGRKHIIFAESPEDAIRLSSKGKEHEVLEEDMPSENSNDDADLGWKLEKSVNKSRSKPQKSVRGNAVDQLDHLESELPGKRHRLLKELSARLERDKKLRYTQREFEMQRLMMGKGAHKKIAGVEKSDGAEESEEDQDEIDARKGRSRKNTRHVTEETYRPRIYKWRLERKR